MSYYNSAWWLVNIICSQPAGCSNLMNGAWRRRRLQRTFCCHWQHHRMVLEKDLVLILWSQPPITCRLMTTLHTNCQSPHLRASWIKDTTNTLMALLETNGSERPFHQLSFNDCMLVSNMEGSHVSMSQHENKPRLSFCVHRAKSGRHTICCF